MTYEEDFLASGCGRDKSCEKKKLKQYIRRKRRCRERSSNYPNNTEHRRRLRILRQRLEHHEFYVQDDDPLERTNLLSGQNLYNQSLKNFCTVELENAGILMRIKNLELGNKKPIKPPPLILKSDRARQIKLFQQTYDNCIHYRRLQDVKAEIRREAQLEWFKKQKIIGMLHSKYVPYWIPAPSKPYEIYAYRKSQQNPRPITFMDFEVRNRICGRVIFELLADICPITAENFRALCVGKRGRSYRNHNLERVLPGFFWRGAGHSPHGSTFPVENYRLKHNEPGILSMVGMGKVAHRTEFMISARPLPSMDKENIAFGRVIEGMDFLIELATVCEPYESGKPRIPVRINNCGETSINEIPNLEEPKFLRELKVEEKLAGALERRPVAQCIPIVTPNSGV